MEKQLSNDKQTVKTGYAGEKRSCNTCSSDPARDAVTCCACVDGSKWSGKYYSPEESPVYRIN